MNNKTFGIAAALIVVFVMAYLVINLATPCNGSYKFSLKEWNFACEQNPDQPLKLAPITTQAPSPCNVFLSDFTSQSSENDNFELVLAKLDSEMVTTLQSCGSASSDEAVQKLLYHYGEQRLLYLRVKRVSIQYERSATVGSPGSKKKYELRAECPSQMIVETPTVSKSGVGGCYLTATPVGQAFISGVVSQTGKGRSKCTITAQCMLSEARIQELTQAETIQLRARTAH